MESDTEGSREVYCSVIRLDVSRMYTILPYSSCADLDVLAYVSQSCVMIHSGIVWSQDATRKATNHVIEMTGRSHIAGTVPGEHVRPAVNKVFPNCKTLQCTLIARNQALWTISTIALTTMADQDLDEYPFPTMSRPLPQPTQHISPTPASVTVGSANVTAYANGNEAISSSRFSNLTHDGHGLIYQHQPSATAAADDGQPGSSTLSTFPRDPQRLQSISQHRLATNRRRRAPQAHSSPQATSTTQAPPSHSSSSSTPTTSPPPYIFPPQFDMRAYLINIQRTNELCRQRRERDALARAKEAAQQRDAAAKKGAERKRVALPPVWSWLLVVVIFVVVLWVVGLWVMVEMMLKTGWGVDLGPLRGKVWRRIIWRVTWWRRRWDRKRGTWVTRPIFRG
jgi:hypothetical protein